MAINVLEELQNNILVNAFRKAKDCKVVSQKIDCDVINIFNNINNINENDMISTMGVLGSHLKSFTSKVDFDHPGLQKMMDKYGLTKDTLKLFQDIAKVSAFIRENDLNTLSSFLTKHLIHGKYAPKDCIRCIAKPWPSILKNKVDRDNARDNKKPKEVKFTSLLESTKFNDIPNNFEVFTCGYDYEHEMKHIQNNYDVLISEGLLDISRNTIQKIEVLRRCIIEQYFGFTQILSAKVAVILAKSFGLSWRDGARQILITRDRFMPDYAFWRASNNILDELDSALRYRAHMYPIHTFKAKQPESVTKLIGLTESYPGYGNKPIFDHYWVCCPSVDIQECIIKTKNNFTWKLRIKKEDHIYQANDSDVSEAVIALDSYFTDEKLFVPVVLGEKDGQCFFLCYWL